MSENDHRTLDDAIAMSQRALQDNMQLRERVADLEEKVERLSAAIPERSSYAELDKDTKIGMVREHLVRKAQQQHDRAAIDYDDVQWEVFDGEPSARHCYDLMDAAANAAGFGIRDVAGENRRLTVDLDSTNAATGFFTGNKNHSEGAGR